MHARTLALAGLLGSTLAFGASAAFAQIAPDDAGLGYKLGIQQQNNSGEVGTMTLFKRNHGNDTLVVVSMAGEPAGRRQPAHIHRGKDCDSIDPKPAYPLAPLVNGASRTIVHASESKLLSGNYSVNFHSENNIAHYVACGHLY